MFNYSTDNMKLKLIIATGAALGLFTTFAHADGGYAGALVAWVAGLRPRNPLRLEIVKRSDDQKGFVVLPRRWVVERTFAWLSFHRRLSKDYEALPATSETMIYVAMIRLMVARLA